MERQIVPVSVLLGSRTVCGHAAQRLPLLLAACVTTCREMTGFQDRGV